MSRILVTGRYINKGTYELVREDGSVYQTIREGEPFRIDNQIREWVPVRVSKKSGAGTILICRKYRDNGTVMEEFPLLHNKKGLWATSSGSARNGVFHPYRAPKTLIEKRVREWGCGPSVIHMVSSIDETLDIGGEMCHHVVNKWGYDAVTDCQIDELTEPGYADDPRNPYHCGCMNTTYTSHFSGGTYLVYYSINTNFVGRTYTNLIGVWITPDADQTEVLYALNK